MGFFLKLFGFFKKPRSERKKKTKFILQRFSGRFLSFVKIRLPFTYFTFQPDSYAISNLHTEFPELYKSFIAKNKSNNTGDIVRLWSFILNIKQVLSENVTGDFAELGVWRGNTASILAWYAASFNRKLYLFDTFEGFDEKDLSGIDINKKMAFSDTSVSMVKDVIGKSYKSCVFVKGHFPSIITSEHKENKYSIVSIDCDLYKPMKDGLGFFYPRMTQGGLFLLHDYSSNEWDGARKAIDEFCSENQERVILMPDKSGSAFIRKSSFSGVSI